MFKEKKNRINSFYKYSLVDTYKQMKEIIFANSEHTLLRITKWTMMQRHINELIFMETPFIWSIRISLMWTVEISFRWSVRLSTMWSVYLSLKWPVEISLAWSLQLSLSCSCNEVKSFTQSNNSIMFHLPMLGK